MTTLPLASSPTTGGCGCGGCGCGGGQASADAAATVAAGAAIPDVAAPDTSAGATPASALSEQEPQPGDLDVRSLPPAQRHALIFSTVAALLPGEAFVLTNDHDPKPLRYQLDAEEPGQIGWEYRAQGPDVWRVQISRVAGHCC